MTSHPIKINNFIKIGCNNKLISIINKGLNVVTSYIFTYEVG